MTNQETEMTGHVQWRQEEPKGEGFTRDDGLFFQSVKYGYMVKFLVGDEEEQEWVTVFCDDPDEVPYVKKGELVKVKGERDEEYDTITGEIIPIVEDGGYVFDRREAEIQLNGESFEYRPGGVEIETGEDADKWVAGLAQDQDLFAEMNELREALETNGYDRSEESITVKANARVVGYYYGEATALLLDSDSDAEIVEKDIPAIEKEQRRRTEEQQWNKFVKAVRKKLREQRAMNKVDVEELAEEHEVEVEEPEELLKEETMRPDYEPEYLEKLYNVCDEEDRYFIEEGFVFETENHIVYEEPKHGAATYVFERRLDPRVLVDKLLSTGKLTVIRSDEVQERLGLIGRAIHTEMGSWSEKMDELGVAMN